MRSLILAIACLAVALFAGEALAQCSAGCNVNTRQAGRVPAEPDPVPQALAELKVEKREVRGFVAPEVVAQREARAGDLTSLAGYRQPVDETLPVQPIGLNLGFVNAGNRDGADRRDIDALIAETRAANAAVDRKFEQLQHQVAEMKARGVAVDPADVLRAVEQIRAQQHPTVVTQNVVSDPQFAEVVSQVVNRVLESRGAGGPQAIEVEIVPLD